MKGDIGVALDRPLPQNPDAERAVLGSILILNAAMSRVRLTVDDFYKDANRSIYAAMTSLFAEHEEIDGLTLKNELERHGKLEAVGGSAYIAALTEAVPDVANVERYAAIVAEQASKRRLIVIGNQIMREGLDPLSTADEVRTLALQAIGVDVTPNAQKAKHLSVVMGEACEAQQLRFEGKQKELSLRTGIDVLDSCNAVRRAFTLILSPSEHGKTAWAVNLSSALSDNGYRGVFFTLETTAEEVALRYAAMRGRIAHGLVQDWRLMNEKSFAQLAIARRDAAKSGIFIVDAIRAVEHIALECRRLKAVEGIDFAFVDYIQIVRLLGVQRGMNEERILNEIGQTLFETAKDLSIFIGATSQVRDEWQKRGRIIKEDAKGCRSLSEAARVVQAFHRQRAADKTNEKFKWCEVQFQVEKNNQGRTRDVRLHFDERTQRFGEGTSDPSKPWIEVCEMNDCTSLGPRSTVQQNLIG